MSAPTPAEMREALKDVFDPELGYNIVELGLVYELDMVNDRAFVVMTLTTPGCPASDIIQLGVRQRLEQMEGVNDVHIELVWRPEWSAEKMSPEAKAHFRIT